MKQQIIEEMEYLIGEIRNMEVDDELYKVSVERLTDLHKILQEDRKLDLEETKLETLLIEQEERAKFKVDWNLLMNGALSIASILLVLNYEKENIITTKSWNIAGKWIGKGK